MGGGSGLNLPLEGSIWKFQDKQVPKASWEGLKIGGLTTGGLATGGLTTGGLETGGGRRGGLDWTFQDKQVPNASQEGARWPEKGGIFIAVSVGVSEIELHDSIGKCWNIHMTWKGGVFIAVPILTGRKNEYKTKHWSAHYFKYIWHLTQYLADTSTQANRCQKKRSTQFQGQKLRYPHEDWGVVPSRLSTLSLKPLCDLDLSVPFLYSIKIALPRQGGRGGGGVTARDSSKGDRRKPAMQ